MNYPSYNQYNPHAQGSNGSYPPSGNLPFPAHGSQSGLPPGDGTGRHYTPQNTAVIPHQYLSPSTSHNLYTVTHGPSQSGPLPLDGGTGRGHPPRYTPQNDVSRQVVVPRQDLSPSTSYNLYTATHGPSQSGPLPLDDGTGRGLPPWYTPQNDVSRQVVVPRQDLSPSTSYNPYTTTHGPSRSDPLPDDYTGRGYPPPRYLPSPAHGISHPPPDPPYPPPNPASKERGPPPPDRSSHGGDTRQRSRMLSMIRYVNEFFL